ncbi:MAG: DNA polymerase III subunit beta [Gammaproteobacteria bacterium]|nr:MAG: DNA polymerase III subunit beta [Gammaproteobacteria bacterium]
MKLTISRESLLKPLQAVIGVVERRQTMPILANVRLVAADGGLTVTATDLEVELQARTGADKLERGGEITVPGRKLLDICRALPDGVDIRLQLDGDRLQLRSGRSRFVLSTLPAEDFPVIDDIEASNELRLPQADFGALLDRTHFAMAQQDVRYYLNGLLLEVGADRLRAVATDGHRLALSEIEIDGARTSQQVIVPRKGVLELQRLLENDGEIALAIGPKHLRARLDHIQFTSKLIDGRFPDYQRVIPDPKDNVLRADRDALRRALQRAAILSNEKYRGVRLEVTADQLTIQANNPDQEEAQDEVEVEYQGTPLEIGFNVTYLLDALGAVEGDAVEVGFVDANSSCLIHAPGVEQTRYVVMPMRL